MTGTYLIVFGIVIIVLILTDFFVEIKNIQYKVKSKQYHKN